MARTDPKPSMWRPICGRSDPHPQNGCKECSKVYTERHKEERTRTRIQWGKDNPERRRLTMKRHQLKKRGWKLEEFFEALEAQGGLCYLCGQKPTDENGRKPGKPGTYSDLEADNCHRTGRRRHLLCARCNRGLSFFDDNPTLFLKAAMYVSPIVDEQLRDRFAVIESALAAKESVIDALLAHPMTMED